MATEEEPVAIRRSRREKKKSSASSALEKIRRSRETGVVDDTELEAPGALFDYVDEEEYARIVQQRQREGFIMDDDGSYSEHGREIFDEPITMETTPSSSTGERGAGKAPRKVARATSNIKTMLMGREGSRKKRKKEDSVSLEGDAVLNDILQQMGSSSGPHTVPRGTTSRTAQRSMDGTPRRPPPKFTPRSSTPHSQRPPRTKRIRVKSTTSPPPPLSPSPPPPSNWEDDFDNVADAMDTVCGDEGVKSEDVKSEGVSSEAVQSEGVGSEGVEATKEEDIAVPEAAVSASGWETVREELGNTMETLSSISVNSSTLPTQLVDGEEVVVFYLLDAFEAPFHQPGTAFLFGKVWVPDAKTHVSCCVTVKNIERCLYLLPREKVLDQSGGRTEQDVSMEDVYQEFNSRYAEQLHIKRFRSKRVTKKYAFEKVEVPHESEYLEVRYSTDHPAPPANASGRTFSHIFGTNTSSLERLILKRNLKGPAWLHIKQASCPAQALSWCRVECVVESMESVSVVQAPPPAPPLVVVSLAMKLTLNPRTGANEVLCVAALLHPSLSLTQPPPRTPFQADFCTIRRLTDRDFPFGFDEYVKKKKFNVEVAPSERAMLAYFLAKLHRVDPDIIVGHNLSSFQLELLQHRLHACRVPQWSRIGRLKRRDMPKGHSAGHFLCVGRPVCDVKTSAKELIRARSYDLSELSSSLLHTSHTPMEHEEVVRAFSHCERLGGVIAHTFGEAMLALRLMMELNALPLAYQITCLAGNTLSRTLLGGRAERNEFLLLHAFTAKDYICPDKRPPSKGGRHRPEDSEEVEGGGGGAGGRGKRKPAYSGGLVLEPKKGFYDRFILLLDFNSLYPSIIQEYNICFTTVDHASCSLGSEDDFSQLQLPEPSVALGVLPSEIRVLVERRRQVKKLMRAAVDSPDQYAQYDIRQKALKLTANSMYGCLGFTNSRFYARPLAALVTGKGRAILAHTKDLAQQLNLDVIYGDTDSIMIDSNTRDLAEAEKIAQKVKEAVNKLYRLLEIDVDGIYKAMLLLKKKKYAAVAVERRDGHLVERREVKGLDIVRRDWSSLAKKSGYYVLDQILSGAELDKVIELVKSHLQGVHQEVIEGHVPLEDFVITKSLTKAPSEYPDKKGQPHVQVALRMLSRSLHVQAGDVIPYVMCKGGGGEPAALRAFHPDEVRAQDHLSLDTHYYLQHQLHAVVSRLCQPIPGLDAAQLAECLGLDPSGYRQSAAVEEAEGEGEEFSLHGLGEKGGASFEGEPLLVRCPHCKEHVEIKSPQAAAGGAGGLECPGCSRSLGAGLVRNSITLAARAHISRYYTGWMRCEDQSCQHATRSVSIALEDAAPCCPACKHSCLRQERPASTLYHQLMTFQQLFEHNGQAGLAPLKSHAADIMRSNSFSQVNLAGLFPALN